MDLSSKNIAIIGMARTGLAAAEVIKDLGGRVVLYDRKSADELGESLDAVRRLGVEARPGTDDVDLDGVSMLVPSPGVPANSPVFADAFARGVEIVSEIELAYRIAEAPIVAITGTNGKTTTTVLAGRIFSADGRESYVAGNVAAGDIKLPLITAAHRASANAVIVAEISTFQLEWISSFRPRAAALLNVTSDHQDRHSSVEEYATLKARIFENQTPEDFAVINAENAFTASLAPSLRGRVLRFARLSEVAEGAWLRGNELVARLDGKESVMCMREDISLRGEHNVENVLAAGLLAVAMGARPQSVAAAVRQFTPVEHRLEPVAIIDGVEYINNSMCTNVDAAVRSVEAIDEPQIVIAGGKAKGSDYATLGEALRRKAKHLVIMGADGHLIGEAAQRAGLVAISGANSMREAVRAAGAVAKPGDVVVLTPGCASFDMFSSFEERGRVFKEIVRELEREGALSDEARC